MTTAVITTTTTTTTANSNNHGNNAVAATQLTLSQKGIAPLVPVATEILSPQKLGGTTTVPVIQGPGPTPIIINSTPLPLK